MLWMYKNVIICIYIYIYIYIYVLMHINIKYSLNNFIQILYIILRIKSEQNKIYNLEYQRYDIFRYSITKFARNAGILMYVKLR